MAEFEVDLKANLYKLWNRLSSGSYFPPPVRAVEIPKRDGSLRVLGVPTVADRIAQTVVRGYLEPCVEPVFHEDSYGYRPGRSAHQALRVCRERCWRNDWVLDLDIRAFFDSVSWELVLKAVAHRSSSVLPRPPPGREPRSLARWRANARPAPPRRGGVPQAATGRSPC